VRAMTTERAEGPPAAPHVRPERRRRLSKSAGRTIAWVAGVVSVALPLGAIAANPKPVVAQAEPQVQQVIVKRIIRHVYQQAPASKAAPKVRYVMAPAAPAPPAPATGSTGGSKP
jgi:hypothetical protein